MRDKDGFTLRWNGNIKTNHGKDRMEIHYKAESRGFAIHLPVRATKDQCPVKTPLQSGVPHYSFDFTHKY